MRYFAVIMIIILTLTACTGEKSFERLEYQEKGLYVLGEFNIDGDTFPAELTLTAPGYDAEGKMLKREGKLIFSKGCVIEGVGFEFSGGEMYIFSGGLKIPIEEETVIEGISSVISLFCISPGSYHSSRKETIDGISCERIAYTDNGNRVEVLLDLDSLYPISISAKVGERELSVKIKEIRSE